MKEYKVPHLPLRYTSRDLIVGVLCILFLFAFFALLPYVTDDDVADEGNIVKECLADSLFYCQALQITDLETGCVTVVIYNGAASGPSAVDISCPGEE